MVIKISSRDGAVGATLTFSSKEDAFAYMADLARRRGCEAVLDAFGVRREGTGARSVLHQLTKQEALDVHDS